jgi:MraZ protein
MTNAGDLYLGEWPRALDERFRLSLPPEWAENLAGESGECAVAKERPGCLSLWNVAQWQAWLTSGVELLRTKLRSGRLASDAAEIQQLGRLLSTRHRAVPIAGRGRLAIPEGFREFLEVEPGGNVLVVGAAGCVELWAPHRWAAHIGEEMPEFRSLFEKLTK